MSDDVAFLSASAVAAIEKRYATVPVYARPTMWAHATLPEHARLRAWLEAELERLDEAAQAQFVSRLRDPDLYGGALAELATGDVLRQPGYTVAYGVEFDGLTPDIILTDPAGRQLIAEVWRRRLATGIASKNSRWMELTRHLRRIRVPVALAVDSIDHGVVEPPDAPTRLQITGAVRAWLAVDETMRPDALEVADLRFRIVGDGLRGRTELLPVRTGSAATRDLVISAIEQKVKRYRKLAHKLDLPLVVVLSADNETGLSRDHVEHTLAGHNMISVSIPPYGVGAIHTGPIRILPESRPPTFDSALAGVAWLDVNDGVHAELTGFWPMPNAARPVTRLEIDASADPPERG